MDFYNNRIEIKYLMNEEKYHDIFNFLDCYGVADKHNIGQEGYKINTFYLATWKSFTRTAKNHGRLRIRSYSANGKIYLEEKSKIRNRYYKQRYLINNEDRELLKTFCKLSQIENYSQINKFEFSNQLYFISDFDKFEVDYTRLAYAVEYEGLKFRATIDSNLKSVDTFLIPNKYILELKMNEGFREVSELFLKTFGLMPHKISKYKLLAAIFNR